jgi:hypothetical protein
MYFRYEVLSMPSSSSSKRLPYFCQFWHHTCVILLTSAIFLKKKSSGTHNYTIGRLFIWMAGNTRFRNAVLVYILLRNNFQDGVPARSATKIPLLLTPCKVYDACNMHVFILSASVTVHIELTASHRSWNND